MKFTNATSVTNWSAYGVSEYLLLVHPNEEVRNKVVIEKERFYHSYGEKKATCAQPHITLATLLGTHSLEQTLVCQFQQACNSQPAFSVTLNNYSSFYPHTIFLKVLDPYPFKQLTRGFKGISNFYQSHNFPPVRFTKHPHVTIVRGLSEYIYYKAIPEYEQRSFYESFTVTELVLLKRKHQFDVCQTVGVFQLRSPNPPSVQLKLAL